MEAAPQRKRRKWDTAEPKGVPIQPGQSTAAPAAPVIPAAAAVPAAAEPKPSQPMDADAIARAKQDAAAIMQKINKDLAARGMGNFDFRQSFSAGPEVTREVTINAAAPQIRNHLTKRSTQDDIARRTGTSVVVRGRFLPPGSAQPASEEQPLFLLVTPGLSKNESEAVQQRSVDLAAAEIEAILAGVVHRPGAPPLGLHTPTFQPGASNGIGARVSHNAVAPPPQLVSPGQYTPPGQYTSPGQQQLTTAPGQAPYTPAQQTAKLWMGFEPPAEFQLASRLRGPGDSYLQHISRETHTTVSLHGRGSVINESVEPLHLLVTAAPGTPGYEEAKKLAQNLIDTVRGEHLKLYPNSQQPSPGHALPPSPQQPGYAAAPAGSQPPPAGSYQHYPPASPYPPQQQRPPVYAPPPVASQYPQQYTPPQSYPQGYPPPHQPAPYAAGYPPVPPQPGSAPQRPPYYQPPPQQQYAPPGSSTAGGYPQRPPGGYSGLPPPGPHGQGYCYPPPQSQAPRAPPQQYSSPGAPQHAAAYQPQQAAAPPQYHHQQQQPPSYGQPAPDASSRPAAGGYPGGAQGVAGNPPEAPAKRRFREAKEEASPPSAQVHHLPQTGLVGPQRQAEHSSDSASYQPGSMGPPPPRLGAMGPPPPRLPGMTNPPSQGGPMGPPPPRSAAGGHASGVLNAGASAAGEVPTILGGLAEYGDED